MKKKLLRGGLAVALLLAPAFAAADKIDDAIAYRKAVMEAQKWNLGQMAAMVKGSVAYDKAAFVRYAQWLDELSPMPWDGFPKGSDVGDTKARADIWNKPAEFSDKAKALETESAKLVEVARSGDMGKIRFQFGQTAQTCKACHKTFKDR
ncbi:MAG: cytochrome c [Acidihalobacter sp.]